MDVQNIQNLIAGFDAAPGERAYQPLYGAIRGEIVEELASLGVGLLTDLKEASAFYLYDATIGVLHIPAPRWSDDRKHAVEAEQKELQSRICRARRQCAENALRKKPFAAIPATPDYCNAVRRKIDNKAREVVVKAPYVYPADKKGLVHDVIVEVYKGQKDGDVINFPLSNPADGAALVGVIMMAKSAAFAHYNRHKGRFKKELNPADYGVWVYIDDYPDGMPNGNGFSGTSFTLAVAIGIWACLRKIKMDEKHEIAASGEINSPQGGLNNIGSIFLKAKAARLGGVERFFASIDIAKELEALSSIIEARKIQFSLCPNQCPDNTEVIPVHSLEDVLKEISTQNSKSPWMPKIIVQIVVNFFVREHPWVPIGMAIFMLLAGVSWFHFEKPTPISSRFYVNQSEIEGHEGETRAIVVYAKFRSRIGTTLWLKLASLFYGRFYWIECPKNVSGPELVIRNANFNAKIQFTVPRRNESIPFILKDRDGNVFASADVDIKVISRIP